MGAVIQINPQGIRLKRKVRAHLSLLGFSRDSSGGLLLPGSGKEVVRKIHEPQRNTVTMRQEALIIKGLPKLQKYFADGRDIDVAKISPYLERIYSDTWQSDLFKLASLSWSVPVSSGFGRRLRFLVWDRYNEKLIGLIAIGDPVFNLAVRDNFIGWSGIDRKERLVNIMDAYVLGAIPPYNMLLGGKLIASLLRTTEIYQEFSREYGKRPGIISKQDKGARLLAITTSSSMGRSSVYNRLRVHDTKYLQSIGFSGGWGHFHVPDDLFESMRGYLREIGHKYADYHAFGQGSNWRIRTIRAALAELGFKGDMLKHGIQREVFISLLADNSIALLSGCGGEPNLRSLQSTNEVGNVARERWLIPRAASRPEFSEWTRANWLELICKNGRSPVASMDSKCVSSVPNDKNS